MPTTNARELTLTRDGSNVKITVTYNAVFNTLERHFAGLGMRFIERIAVIGVDPPGATTGTVLKEFPGQFIQVSGGVGTLSVPRSREITMTRFELDEDRNPILPPDALPDEIRCRIRVESTGLPLPVTPDAFTDEKVLDSVIQ